MKKNSELPKLRIDSELLEKMENILKKLNENDAGVEIPMSAFRRMAYKNFIKELIDNGLTLNYKIE